MWIVDAGRLSSRSPSLPFALAADHVLVVTAGSFPALQLVPHRVDSLRTAGCAVGIVVAGPTSWPTDEIAQFATADVIAVVPRVSSRGHGPAAMRSSAWRPWWNRVEQAAGYLDAVDDRRGVSMTIADVTLEDVIEAVQEALVGAQTGGDGRRWDDLEREAFAHDAATDYVARRARAAIEAGESPMDLAAESELIRRAIAAYFHAGKFQSLLDLDGVTDIMINADDAIWLQRVDGKVERHQERVFADAADLRAEVAHLARRAGGTERRFDDAKPLLVLRLPDGSRLAAVMNVSQVPQVAIRRNVLPDATLDELEQRGTIDRGMHSLLTAAMGAGMRIVVSGETGAGKTTLVRAMTNVLPYETRMVVIEDTRELNLAADPRRGVVRAGVGDAGGEHRRRRRDRPARAGPSRPAVQPALADRRRGPRRRRGPGDAAGHAAWSPEPLDRAPPLGPVGVEEAGAIRRSGFGGGRVLDRRPADLRRRGLLRPPRTGPSRSPRGDGDLRGRRLERDRGPAEPVVRARARRPRAPAATPDRHAPEQAARSRLRGPPPPESRRVVGVS